MISEAQAHFQSLPDGPSRYYGLALVRLLQATFRDCETCEHRPERKQRLFLHSKGVPPKPEKDRCACGQEKATRSKHCWRCYTERKSLKRHSGVRA